MQCDSEGEGDSGGEGDRWEGDRGDRGEGEGFTLHSVCVYG